MECRLETTVDFLTMELSASRTIMPWLTKVDSCIEEFDEKAGCVHQKSVILTRSVHLRLLFISQVEIKDD